MKSIESTKIKVTKDKNGENGTLVEITKVEITLVIL